MKNLSLNDNTQEAIIPHLAVTEELISRVISKHYGKSMEAEVTAMPDLGFANNVQRMMGGFYTGMFASWEDEGRGDIVFPDATINSCGVSVWLLNDVIRSQEEFRGRIRKILDCSLESEFDCSNFATGNHFINYGEVTTDEKHIPAVVFHSSAVEFKKDLRRGLYPIPGNWFFDDIKTYQGEDNRYLRYLTGGNARKFIQIATEVIKPFNENRHRFAAMSGFSDILGDEVLNEQHFGMPTPNSISIGSYFSPSNRHLLLTDRGKPSYFVTPSAGGNNSLLVNGHNLLLFPHGLGKRTKDDFASVKYLPDALEINGAKHSNDDPLERSKSTKIRSFTDNECADNIPAIITDVVKKCRALIIGRFDPIMEFCKGNDFLNDI